MIFFSHVIFALSDEAIKFDYSFGEGRESQLEGNFNDKVKEDLKRDFNLLTGDKKEKCDKSVKSFQGVWVSGGNNIDSKLGKIPKKKKQNLYSLSELQLDLLTIFTNLNHK